MTNQCDEEGQKNSEELAKGVQLAEPRGLEVKLLLQAGEDEETTANPEIPKNYQDAQPHWDDLLNGEDNEGHEHEELVRRRVEDGSEGSLFMEFTGEITVHHIGTSRHHEDN